jgi:hypothetical protein
VHLVSKLLTLVDHERVFDLVKVERAQVRLVITLPNLARVDCVHSFS